LRLSSSILIVGGGPSLEGQKDLLRHVPFDTFACNRFTLWEERPFLPTYYACSANAVLRDVEPADPPAAQRRFIVSRRRDQLEGWDGWTPVYKKEWHDLLLPGVEEPLVRGGATMPGIMAQLAIWMGYTKLYFVGIEQRGSGHVYDPNGELRVHYFIPDEDKLFAHWRVIKKTYEDMGVELTDCTPNGRLNGILGYEPLSEVLSGATIPTS